MSFLGNTPTSQSFTSTTERFNGDGSTTTFTMSRAVFTAGDIEVIVNNVQQDPFDAYTVNGTTTLTFTGAPSVGTGNILVTYRNYIVSVVVPAQGTVTNSTLAAGSVTGDKIGLTAITGNLIAAAAITGDKIGLNAITGNLVAAAAITGDKIASATIGSSNLTSTGVTAGIYGGSGNTVNITVDAQGRVTSAANVASAGASAATPTALGTVYGKQTTSGGTPYLTAYGYAAGTSTTGVENVAFGVQALELNVTGTNNTMLGTYAGSKNTNSFNVGIGSHALRNNTSGANNIAIGYAVLVSNATNSNNVGVGHQALNSSTASDNTAVGYQALYNNTISNGNVAVGYRAMYNSNRTSDTDNYSIAIGYECLYAVTTGANNTVVGREAARTGTTFGAVCAFGRNALRNSTANQNSAFGYASGSGVSTGIYNSYFGSENAQSTSTGGYNCGYGYGSLYGVTTGSNNACYGTNAGYALTTGSTNVFLGQDAGRTGSPGGNFTTESNRVVIGNGSVTNAYIQVAWTVTSDARDKTDVVNSKYGLDFIKGLRPVEFKWDKRSNYFKGITDGTHKEAKTQLGFLAQDVIALEKQHGGVAKDLLIADDEKEEEIVSITETKFIPVLVKALQELNAKFDQLKAEHDAYVASHP